MKPSDPEILNRFMLKLEKSFGDRGGVGCKDLIDPTILSNDPLISELVFSMLVWESSIGHAINAVDAIRDGLVDLNELRVCAPDELMSILPSRYPRSLERCQRLVSVLNSIYDLQNELSLSHLREMNKKDVVAYFRKIDGLPPFVSARVILLGLGWHAFPLDDWLTKQLTREDITDGSLDIHDQILRMERLVKASDSLGFYTLLEHWATDQRAAKLSSKSTTSSITRSTIKSTVKTSAKSKGSS